MKKIVFVLSLIVLMTMAFSLKSLAQSSVNQDDKITVKTSDLTVDQLAKIKAQQEIETLQKKLTTYGNWVGVGGEIGAAVKESLNGVVDVADKFGKTDVGRFTMIMVAWKVIGKDIVRMVLGFLLITVMSIFIIKSYKRTCTTHRVCTKSNGIQFWKPKEYTMVETQYSPEGLGFMTFLYIALFFASCGITYAIMFA